MHPGRRRQRKALAWDRSHPTSAAGSSRPSLEAGLDLERIRTLVFRLGFQAVVDPGRDELVDVVRSEPAEVRAAWEAMLRRMLFLGEVTG